MCKNEFFQNSGMKNENFKVHGQKTNFMQNLGMKTILLSRNYKEKFSYDSGVHTKDICWLGFGHPQSTF